MTTKIDNVALTNEPTHIQVVEPEPVASPTAGLAKVVVQPLVPGRIELRWGDVTAAKAAVNELRTKRGNRMQHVLSWTKESNTGTYYRNVVIPLIGYGQDTGAAVDPFTLVMEEIRAMPALAAVELWRPGTITVADGVVKWRAPAGGRILAVDGFIGTTGTVNGQTRVQISNGSTDYLSTRGDFTWNGNGLMANHVLAASPTFNRNDTIELDIDTIPGGSDSANLQVLLYVILFGV